MEKTVTSVVGHWHHPFEGLQESSQAFYRSLEEALERRQIPDVTISRITYNEEGMFSFRREYLRVERERLVFDLCAAPFGNGFFVSWWIGEARSIWAMLTTAGLIILSLTMMMLFISKFGVFAGSLATILTSLGLLWILATLIRDGTLRVEFTLSDLPLLGWVYDKLFKPDTYYRTDTMLVFMDFVAGAVMEVIDRMTNEKGYRVLTEQERKPILMDLFKR